MKRKMSNTGKLNLSNARHWSLCWMHNQKYLNTVNETERRIERVNFYYHNAVRNAQIDCGRKLTRAEKRQIYVDVKSQLNQD